MLDSFPEPAVVLNGHRQIVLANDKLSSRLRCDRDKLIGMRTGEAFACVHATKDKGCCGTTSFCRYCGGAKAIMDSQASRKPEVQECRLLCSGEEGPMALDLRVWTNPFMFGGEQFTVFAVRDTTDEKRRAVLEQLFFHDILNAATALKGIVKIWPKLNAEQAQQMHRMAGEVTEQILEEIQAQRDLSAAERGDLVVAFDDVDVGLVLSGVCELHRQDAREAGRTVAGPLIEGATVLRTIPLLLRRVLGNLIKNAVEACDRGDTVTVSFENRGAPVFRIHNPGVMPEAVQAQLFQRSFSTKDGSGRGVGTYSVKLFVENYLKGTVGFESTARSGTTFTVTLPSQSALHGAAGEADDRPVPRRLADA